MPDTDWTWKDTDETWPNGSRSSVSEGRLEPIWCRIVWPAEHTCRYPHVLWSGPGRDRYWYKMPTSGGDWERVDQEDKDDAKRAVEERVAAFYRDLSWCLNRFWKEPTDA